jgi:hypothetical protein
VKTRRVRVLLLEAGARAAARHCHDGSQAEPPNRFTYQQETTA